MVPVTDDDEDRAEQAREAERRNQVVNAARIYERCLSGRRAFGRDRLKAKLRGESIAGWREIWDAKTRDILAAAGHLTNLLALAPDGDHGALVDGVAYVLTAREDLVRVVPAEFEDWGQVADRRHPGRGGGRGAVET